MPKVIVDLPEDRYFNLSMVQPTCLTLTEYARMTIKPVTPEILEAVEEVCGQYEDVNGGDCAKTVREFFDA